MFRDGSSLGVGGPQRRAVLARLLVSANRRVDVTTLLEDCWGERVTSGSRATLASHVSQLRRVVGDKRVDGRDHGYLLRVGNGESDAACFAAELETGRELLVTGAVADALAVLEAAAGRWRGPALVEFADRSWAMPEVARLEGLHELAGEALIDAVIAVGEPERATVLCEAAVREQPFREHRWVQLMLALYRCGRQREALKAYQRARATIVGQLGLEPSPELTAMQAAVLTHDPRLDWSAPVRHTAGHPIPRPQAAMRQASDARDMSGLPPRQFPFLGRSFEVLKLSTGLAERRLVTLVGPGGVGKTRMALETAWQTRCEFGERPVWVDLAAVQEPPQVLGALATALNLVPSRN
ncbi:MAG TPA: BTAD domain-containing putative transcriptional regulator, partial [Chloroflexota bacterium]